MKRLIAPVVSLAALMAAHPALGQTALTDFVSEVGDITYNANAANAYINETACESPSTTNVTIRLQEDGPLSLVSLWVGGQNDACEESINRNGDNAVCFEADGNLQTVETNSEIILSIADLEASGLIDCAQEDPSQQGTPFQLYSFRGSNPGTSSPEDLIWGVAPITLDISPPPAPTVTNPGDQPGTTFEVKFTASAETLLRYQLYQLPGCDSDGETGEPTLVPNATAPGTANEIQVSAGDLDFSEEDTVALFVQALDLAENESDLSVEQVCVEAIPTGGFCSQSGECSCSVSWGQQRLPGRSGAVVLAVLCALVGWRRLR